MKFRLTGSTRKREAATMLACASATALLLAACTGSSSDDGDNGSGGEATEQVTLRYAFYGPEPSFPGVQMNEWASLMEERTDGMVTVETFPGGTLLGTGDIYDGITEGVVDVGMDSPHNDAARFPFSSVMNLPLGIPNSQVASAIFLDLIEEFEPTEFDGYHLVTAFTTEPAYVLTTTEVTGLDDLAQLEMRTPGPFIRMAEELGITPVSLPAPELAQALQTNLVGGSLSSRDVLKDLSLGEFLNYMVDYPLGIGGTFVALMSEEEYEALPEDVQSEIDTLVEEMSIFASSYHDEVNVAESVEWTQTEHSLQITELSDAERAEWDAIMSSLGDEWVEAHSDADFDAQAVLDRTRELIEEHTGDAS
ncbi:TRAP transporter substrate-binding protein DctP [Georgenia sp. Z1344]|uniref:TRAP transporter substrate-binding protein DctP n=1 Tax=Georgenia sp. Z1344 TaxID=3416706 RepID=UPI003CF4EB29